MTSETKSLLLNGTNQYVLMPDIDNTSLRSAFTMSAWVKSSDVVTDQTIIGIGTGSSVMDMRFYQGGVSLTTYSGSWASVAATTTNTSDVVHVAVTYDGTTARIYYNGSLDNSGTISAASAAATCTFTVGCDQSRAAGFLDGSVAGVILCDVKLEDADITEINNLGVPKQPEDYSTAITDNYVMALPLNTGVVDPETDRSLLSNDGVLTNSPTYTGEVIAFE